MVSVANGDALVLDSFEGNELARLEGDAERIDQIFWSAGAQTIVTSAFVSDRVRLWNPVSGKLLQTLVGPDRLLPNRSRFIRKVRRRWRQQRRDLCVGRRDRPRSELTFVPTTSTWARSGGAPTARACSPRSINSRARLWDVEKREIVTTFCCHDRQTLDAHASPRR